MRLFGVFQLLCLGSIAIICTADSCKELTDFRREITEQFRKFETQFESLKSENNALKQEMRELKKYNYRRADHATEVAFHATLGSGHFSVQDNQKIIYRDVFTNLANAYDASKGIFYAPTAGYYFFLLHFQTLPHKYVETHLKKNGLNVLFTYAGSDGNTFGPSTNSVIIYLGAGDQVWVEVYGYQHASGDVLDGRLNTISGFLLYHTA